MKDGTGQEMLEKFIDFADRIRFEDLPKKVVYETKRRIVDALACAFGSLSDKRVVDLRARYSWNGLKSGAGGLMIGQQSSYEWGTAAFVNTAMIRWLDWNDTYLAKEPAHPSDNLGLLIALADEVKVSGKDFIIAAAVAYEIQCRLCEAASLRKRGWDHVNYILISSTLAGAKLLGLNKKQMYGAVAIALNSSVALRQVRAGQSLSEWKGCSAAGAVRNAIFALELVSRANFHGPSEIMDGEFGFVKQVSGDLDPKALDGLGREFLIAETYIKNYPVEYHAQATVENALNIRGKLGKKFNPEEIQEIQLVTYEAAAKIIGDSAKRRPITKETADHSIYYVFAVTLLEGIMTLDQYRTELFSDPKVLALIDRMVLEQSHDFTMSYAASRDRREFPSIAEVTLKNGRKVSDFQKLPLGHPRRPLSDSALNSKFLSLLRSGGRQYAWATDALDELRHLEETENVGRFFKTDMLL